MEKRSIMNKTWNKKLVAHKLLGIPISIGRGSTIMIFASSSAKSEAVCITAAICRIEAKYIDLYLWAKFLEVGSLTENPSVLS